MRYKVGNRVKIKSLYWYEKNKDEYGYVDCGKCLMNFENSQLCGKIVTISHINDVTGTYKIEEDNGLFFWTDEMIECKVEEKASTKPEKMSTHSTFVETARGYLVEALSDLNVIDVSHMSDLEKSSLYCAKENIKDALNLLEE